MQKDMQESIRGKVAVVTGARQGLGKIFAHALASSGAEVFLMARNVPALEEAAAEIHEDTGATCHVFPIDVLEESSVARAAQYVQETAGRLDILVNNAALGRGATPLQDTSLEEWNATIGTNLTGTFLCMKHFGRMMIAQKSGKVINMTSMAARAVLKGACTGAYDCSKAGVGCLTRCMAAEWAQYGIQVNSISPGFFLTDINKQFLADTPGFYESSCQGVPLGRWGAPEELAPLLLFLASSASDYITGADFNMDGGYTLW